MQPNQYPELESAPVPLLSRIYDHLASHFQRHSPSMILATIAFILTSSSEEYVQELARSIGFGGQPKLVKARRQRTDILDLDDDEEEEDIFDQLDAIETTFPTFFPQTVLQLLPAAQKSLVLFQIAQPNHPLLMKPNSKSSVRWLWTNKEVEAAWNGLPLPSGPSPFVKFIPPPSTSTITYKPELLGFQMFDLDPAPTTFGVGDTSSATLGSFILNFPQQLPSMTPTLAELTSLTFKGITQHASTLSSTLLSIFISSTGKLNFCSHLVLLRSYLLIAEPSFKSRLLNALFSDAGMNEVDVTAHSMTIQSLRHRQGKSTSRQSKDSKQPWAVGLSPHLLERETWPPVGADLSFFLRTVIVDSLDKGKENEEGKFEREDVIEEAGWRLGFAIRDLPTGPGRDKWLDPLCVFLHFCLQLYANPHSPS